MIIQKGIPFEGMARFLHGNVCDMPKVLKLRPPERISAKALRAGLSDLLDLLREVYADVPTFRRSDDKASYAALSDTVHFLHACTSAGGIEATSGGFACVVAKKALRAAYKRGGVAAIADRLGHYGLRVAYHRAGEACRSLAQADELVLTTDRERGLFPAAKALAAAADQASLAERGDTRHATAIFIKGDHDTAVGLRPPTRRSLEPLRSDILRTVGRYEDEWRGLAAALGELGTACSGMFGYGFPPVWSVSFTEPRKRPIAIFTLAAERVFMEFTLPVRTAEGIIRDRAGLPASIRKRIERFGCVKCPRQCEGKHMRNIDGVSLCTGRAEARRIYMVLAEADEFAAVRSMVHP